MTGSKQRISLNQGWTASLAAGKPGVELPESIRATVPGSIHTDLMAAGLIPDPFLDDNERLLAWIGYCDWTYRLDFEWRGTTLKHTDLVFEGLDTVADVFLNGDRLVSVKNQHRSYRLPISKQLRAGANLIEVRFTSPIKYADRMSLELGYRPHVNHHPYNAVRKMAANFGWDWGIDTSTVGIWKPVYLESYNARIVSVRPVCSLTDGRGVIQANVELSEVPSTSMKIRCAGKEVTIGNPVAGNNLATLEIDDPEIWYPNGDGSQNLYSFEVSLGESDIEDSFECKVGFRNVELKFPESTEGVGFEFHVNGKPTYIRGANWIPNDAFVHRITREQLADRLTQAKDANINLIRVWGGGLYESDDFYELCNELGLMVWQDFLFACAAYSEEGLAAEVEAEARENITRIMKHPSLVLWNGNNENLWGHQEWNWQQRLEGKSWGEGFYFDLLPSLVTELDPGRAYTPGSPYSPNPELLHNDPEYGSVHIWDLWNQKDYPHYRDYRPRFVAEFGWQGPANWATIRSAISDNPLTPESPGMIVHQKAISGNDKLTDGLVNHFPLPNQMEDWHWAMQLNQANAIRFGLEHMRSEFPRCMGSVVWQLNDCWPVTSWAAIDGSGSEKPLYFAISQSYEDLLVTVSIDHDQPLVSVVNNSPLSQEHTLIAELLAFDGRVIQNYTQALSVAANEKERLSLPKEFSSAESLESSLLRVSFGTATRHFFFVDYKHSKLQEPDFEAEVFKTGSGVKLKITASNLVRDLLLMVDKLDPKARVSDGLVTLMPGESHTFEIETELDLTANQLTAKNVLRSANQLVVNR